MYGEVNNSLRLEFNHAIMARYTDHSKLANGILYNPNAMVFTSYNEKGIHVWHPETIEKLFQVNFDIESAKKAAIEHLDEETQII